MVLNQRLRILVTGAGAPAAPGVLRCLEASPLSSILGCDADPEAIGADLYPSFVLLPPAAEVSFVPALLASVDEFRANTLLDLGGLPANSHLRG